MSQPKRKVVDIINTIARLLHPTLHRSAPLPIQGGVLVLLEAIVVVKLAFFVCDGILIPPRGILELVLVCVSVEDESLGDAPVEVFEGSLERVVVLAVVGR